MMTRTTAGRLSSIAGALSLCAAAMAQQPIRQNSAATTEPVRPAPAHPNGPRPTYPTQQPPAHLMRPRSAAPAFFGSQSGGFGISGPGTAAGTNSTAPHPTWELPRTVTPQWEIPSNVNVQPNPVQGNPPQTSQPGVGYGFGFPYYAVPDPYAYVDAGPEPDMTEQTRARHRPEYDARRGEAAHQQPAPAPADAGTAPSPASPRHESDFTDGLEHPEITLVFNDGQPPRKVRSYVMTASTILVIENGHQTRIPISELDGPATNAKNRAAGVDFTLPATR